MTPSLILYSILRDIATCARDQVVPHPDVEVVMSREMRHLIVDALQENDNAVSETNPPVEQLHQARITTLWNAEGCFAVVRIRRPVQDCK